MDDTKNTKFTDYIEAAVSWKFLDEPFWRWVVFLIALSGALVATKGLLRHME